MAQITQMPKPEAGQYKDNRKLFLVPTYNFGPDAPAEGNQLLERYWSEVRDHVDNLERTLGKIARVYHEEVFSAGPEGMEMLEARNHMASSFVKAMCHTNATLQVTEDSALVQESSDWQRCLYMGLISEKVRTAVMEGLEQATLQRYEYVGKTIDETLEESEVGILFIRENHRIQFSPDIQVFYVAPPALDSLKRWMDDQIRATARQFEEATQEERPVPEADLTEEEGAASD